MAREKRQKNAQPLTTAQRLSSIVKSCRDIMRKDKGLNGDLDRLPMLTWIMFLKFLDDMEQIAEEAPMARQVLSPRRSNSRCLGPLFSGDFRSQVIEPATEVGNIVKRFFGYGLSRCAGLSAVPTKNDDACVVVLHR